jgi:hypothetical protein
LGNFFHSFIPLPLPLPPPLLLLLLPLLLPLLLLLLLLLLLQGSPLWSRCTHWATTLCQTPSMQAACATTAWRHW